MDDISEVISIFNGTDPALPVIVAATVTISITFFFLALLGMTGYFPTLLAIALYAHPVARVKALGTPFIRMSLILELLESGMYREALARVQAFGYRIDNAVTGDTFLIEKECQALSLIEMDRLIQTVPYDVSPFFTAYLSFNEITLMKRAIRMIHGSVPAEDIRKMLFPLGLLTHERIVRISECTSMEEFVSEFRGTPYEIPLVRSLGAYHDQNLVLPLEMALDHMGYARILSSVTLVRSPLVTPFQEIVSIITDLQNIRTLIRAKHSGCDPQLVSGWLLEGGRKFPSWRLTQLNEMMSVPDLIIQMAGTGYDTILTSFREQYPKSDCFLSLDKALDEYLLGEAGRISVVYYHTGGPLVRFLIAKGFEMNNIRVLLSGLAQGVSSGVIMSGIITEPEAA